MVRHRPCPRGAILALALLAGLGTAFAQSPSEPLRVRRNFLGMHNLMNGGVTPFQTGQDWTRTLVGDGFVMDWVTDYAPEAPNHWLREAMDRGLVPVVRVQHCQKLDRDDCEPSVGYSVNVAAQILEWKVRNPQYASRYVYMALWNEPGDARDYVPMDKYADFLVAAYAGIRTIENQYAAAHPELGLKGTLMVMTPGQNDGWADAFSHNPQAKFAFDVWATHPYPDMTPPWHNIHDGDLPANWLKTIDSYIQDLDECARTHNGVPGRRGFPVMITETNYGWFVGHSTVGWPKLTQEARAPFTVDAFFKRWYEWPEILAVHPFLLNANAWPAFEFVHSWSSKDEESPFGVLEPANPLPVYTALKQAREDHEARGLLAPARLSPYRGLVGNIRGRVTRRDNGQPVPYATLATDGYEFGHLTLFDGVYEIHDVPAGSYTLSFQKASHLPASRPITVSAGQTTVADFSVTFTGKVLETLYSVHDRHGICDSACANQNAVDHWQAFVTGPETAWIKFASAGIKGDGITMRFTVHEGGPNGPQVGPAVLATNPASAGDQIIGAEWPDGQEPAVLPNTTYWLRFQRADGQAIYCYASNQDPYPRGGSSSSPGVDFYGTIYGLTRELNVATGAFAGAVRDALGSPLGGATVSRSPGSVTTTTGSDGSWTMGGVPVGTYSLTAEKPGYRSQTVSGQAVVEGATTTVDFALAALPPTIALSTTSLSASTTQGASPSAKSFTVQNTGGGVLRYAVAADEAWLSASPSSGTSTGEADPVTVSFSTASLPVGTHRALVSVSDPSADNSPQRIDVTLTVTPAGATFVGHDFESMPAWSSTFDAAWGSPASWAIVPGGALGQALQASRASGGSSSRVAVFSVQPATEYEVSLYFRCPSFASSYWAEAAYRLGEATAQDFDQGPSAWTLVQKFSSSGTNGNGNTWRAYSARFNSGASTRISVGFKLGSTGAGPTVQWDTLRITSTAPPPAPVIALSPTSLSASVVQGHNAPSQTFTVRNQGGGTLTYVVTESLPWLSVTPSSGTSTGEADTLTVQYASPGLAPGSYAGAISVADPAASNSPQSVTVTLTVSAGAALGEDFETMPAWATSYDAPWGTPASWAIVGGGQAGQALQASRTTAGSSSKVLVRSLQPNRTYTLSVYVRCPASTSTYWAEAAYRLGRFTAQDFDANASAWTLVKKFSPATANGNGNTWTRYAVTFASGGATEVSVGFKLGASGSAPTVAWDTLRIE
jgi:hypothetical protein